MKSQMIPWTYLSYYTWIDPAVYDIKYRPLPPEAVGEHFPDRFNPRPGVYTLSATTLQGIMVPDPNVYDWFRHREPTAQPGYGLLVYNIEPETVAPQWIAQCTLPVSPLKETDISSGFGNEKFRIIYYDCSETWVYPAAGSVPGWYILHGDILNLHDSFIDGFLSYSAMSYQQRAPGQLPAFAIFKQSENELPPSLPVQAVFGQDKLTLSGYSLSTPTPEPGQTIEVDSWWSVSSIPDRPLSLMMHLTDAQSGTVVVGDGLGLPVTEWQEGDIIVQRHRITLPENIKDAVYEVKLGVYWLDTLERWEVTTQLPSQDNAITITQIQVD